jgi:hypothetical protein
MQKIVIYALLVNVTVSVLFVASNFTLWSTINDWNTSSVGSMWSPFLVVAHRSPDLPPVQMPFLPQFNVPFLLFWFALAANLYFILKLGRLNQIKSS